MNQCLNNNYFFFRTSLIIEIISNIITSKDDLRSIKDGKKIDLE